MGPRRRNGRTAQIILYAHLYDKQIVCFSEVEKQRIIEVAKILGISVHEPIVRLTNKEAQYEHKRKDN